MKPGWQKAPFDAVITDESGGNIKTPQSEFLAAGHYAVVDQGKELIAGYVNDESRLCRAQLPVIVFGDHTRCFKYVDFPFCMGADGIKVLRPKVGADVKYLYHYLRQVYLREGGYDRHFKYLKRTDIVLPPRSEQRRIAEVLDRAEVLRVKRRDALVQLDTLTQSIFLDMFTRGLDGPVVDVAENRLGVPNGWSWELLTNVARLATGHTPDRERSDFWNGDIPWISLTDIRELDGRVATQTIQNVTPLGIDNSSSVVLPRGTVCFSRTASVGFVTMMGREMATSQDFVNWVCGPRLLPTYLMCALLSARRRLQALSSGSTHKTIYMRVVEQFRALVPPVTLQQEFARRIGAVEKMRTTYRAALVDLDALFVSLQYRAFRGEL